MEGKKESLVSFLSFKAEYVPTGIEQKTLCSVAALRPSLISLSLSIYLSISCKWIAGLMSPSSCVLLCCGVSEALFFPLSSSRAATNELALWFVRSSEGPFDS